MPSGEYTEHSSLLTNNFGDCDGRTSSECYDNYLLEDHENEPSGTNLNDFGISVKEDARHEDLSKIVKSITVPNEDKIKGKGNY